MRISTWMVQQDALRTLRVGLGNLSRAQLEAATGQRLRTVSDDPVDAGRILRIDGYLRDVDQYRRNLVSANAKLATEDVVLTSSRELLSRARELAMGVSGLPPGDPRRDAALAEVAEIREQLISLGNTRVGGEFIFGGSRTQTPPFLQDGTYMGDQAVRQTAIDTGVLLDTNHTGEPLFTGALQAMANLGTALQGGDTAAIEGVVQQLRDAETQVLVAQTVTGSRLRQVADTEGQLGRRANGLLDQREALRDVDPAEALLRVTTAQTALERAYAVIGRVSSVNLLNYLR